MENLIDIKFQFDRKNILLIGKYDPQNKDVEERLNVWGVVAEAGIELVAQLAGYRAKISKLVQYEVVEGEIVFDVQVTANKDIKKKAIAAVQDFMKSETQQQQAVIWIQNDPGVTQ